MMNGRTAGVPRGMRALRLASGAAIALAGVLPAQVVAAQVTERVSVGGGGTQGNLSSSYPDLSADGRYVVFQSDATNLLGSTQYATTAILLRDTQASTTELISVGVGGAKANGRSDEAKTSADARYIVFESDASNLVPGDTNGHRDVFVRDRLAKTTSRVSIGPGGAQGNADSYSADISADGRHVAFSSYATNLVAGDSNGTYDVFVHDRQTGRTERVSVASDGVQGNAGSTDPGISADGRMVSFNSYASNLVSDDRNGEGDIFVRDRLTGSTQRVSVSSAEAEADWDSGGQAISSDGRYVVFGSFAKNLVPDDPGFVPSPPGYLNPGDIYLRDLLAGTTERVSKGPGGAMNNGQSYYPTVSGDGRFVAFASHGSALVPDDTNGSPDIFLRDRQRGVTSRVNLATCGAQTPAERDSYAASLSADGRRVGFDSEAANLVPGDTNDGPLYEGGQDFGRDVFLRGPLDDLSEPNRVCNPSFEADLSGWGSFGGTLSRVAVSGAPDGRYVARATWRSGTTLTISDSQGGNPPTIRGASAGSEWVATAFVRAATSSSVGKSLDIFLRELRADGAVVKETKTTTTLSSGFKRVSVGAVVSTPGGSLGLRLSQNGAVRGNAIDGDLITLRATQPLAGSTAVGSVWTPLTPNAKRASRAVFTTPAQADLTSLRAYLDGKGAASGSQKLRGVVFADANGAPGALLARTNEMTISAGRAPGWVTLSFPTPVRVASGALWLGLHSGSTTAVARNAATSVAGALRYGPDAYADGTSNPFGSSTTDSKLMSLYAVGG